MTAQISLGQRFGKRVVVSEAIRVKGRAHRMMQCDCGRPPRLVAERQLRKGDAAQCRSCKSRAVFLQHGEGSSQERRSAEYTIWLGMNARCHVPCASNYADYGGRGIKVCDEWRGRGGFERFLSHAGRRPAKGFSIDRIDNLRGYEPGNVRWATREQQTKNRRPFSCAKPGSRYLQAVRWLAEASRAVSYSEARRGIEAPCSTVYVVLERAVRRGHAEKDGCLYRISACGLAWLAQGGVVVG